MSPIVFAFLFLALVAVTGNAKSVSFPPVTAEVISLYNPVPALGRTVWINIAQYSRIRSSEVQTGYIDFEMNNGRTLNVKFGVRHESNRETARLQVKFYTKSSDYKDYSFGICGSLNIHKVEGGTPYTQEFKQTFSQNNPDSDFISLLGRNILMNPARGYYDRFNDRLSIEVPWQECKIKKPEKPGNTGNTKYIGEIAGIVIGSIVFSVIIVSVVVLIVKRRGLNCPAGTSVSFSVGSTTVTQVPPPITTQVAYSASPPSYEYTQSQSISLSAEPVQNTHSQAIPLSTIGEPIQGTPVY